VKLALFLHFLRACHNRPVLQTPFNRSALQVPVSAYCPRDTGIGWQSRIRIAPPCRQEIPQKHSGPRKPDDFNDSPKYRSQHSKINFRPWKPRPPRTPYSRPIPAGQPATHRPNLKLRLNFHEIGLVPLLSPIPPKPPGWQPLSLNLSSPPGLCVTRVARATLESGPSPLPQMAPFTLAPGRAKIPQTFTAPSFEPVTIRLNPVP
jgi:hypothetical protein